MLVINEHLFRCFAKPALNSNRRRIFVPSPKLRANMQIGIAAAVCGWLAALSAGAQTFSVAFGTASSPDCVKNKIGVYQTPFMGTGSYPPLTSMAPFLADAGVHDLRYEIAWGKPDAFAYDQIGGTEASPTIDFTRMDPFVHMLQTNGVAPLFATGYDPVPLKTCTPVCLLAGPPDNYPSTSNPSPNNTPTTIPPVSASRASAMRSGTNRICPAAAARFSSQAIRAITATRLFLRGGRHQRRGERCAGGRAGHRL